MQGLKYAIKLATEAHAGQYRRPVPLPTNLHETTDIAIAEAKKKNPKFSYAFGESVVLGNGARCYRGDKCSMIEQPFVNHPLSVMAMMCTEEEKIVAVLHETLKVKGLGFYNEIKDSFGHRVAQGVLLLTKEHINYSDYIGCIASAKDKLATKVKLADIICELAETVDEETKEKYTKAVSILLKAL